MSEGLVIRYADRSEAPKIVEFLRDHWDANFSVVQSPELFNFLYVDGDRVNFVLALNGENIVATLGVTFYGTETPDVFLTLWRSIDTIHNAGIKLLEFVKEQGYRSISSVGTRKEVLIIYKMLGYKTGTMDHVVRINPDLQDYMILQPSPELSPAPLKESPSGTLNEVNEFSDSFSYFSTRSDRSPFKSRAYLTKRYFNHPIYKYRAFELIMDGEIVNYFVTRTVEICGSSALRLVDCIADEAGFTQFGMHMDLILRNERHEYIDMYCLNMDRSALTNAGFVFSGDYPDMIVPNFFEPFMQQAESKHYITTLDAPCLYKGDGDADRPYRLMAK
jgi:hypothetical protein